MILDKYDIEFRNTLKAQAEQQTNLKLDYINPKSLKTNKGYEVGKKYYNGYWGNIDECIDVSNNIITVKGQDNSIRTHMTELNPVKDFVIVE